MRLPFTTAGLILALLAAQPHTEAAPTAPTDKASAILDAACTHLGGRSKIAGVARFELEAELHHPNGPTVGLKLDVTPGGKISKTEIFNIAAGAAAPGAVTELDGDVLTVRPSPGSTLTIDVKEGEKAAIARELRDQVAWYTAAFFCGAIPSVPLQASYVGRAEAPDGAASVLGLKDAGGRDVGRLFVDEKSHTPLMLTYVGQTARSETVTTTTTTKGSAAEAAPRPSPTPSRSHAVSQEVEWRLADYRVVDGVQLPHLITVSADDEVTAEWNVKKFRLRFAK